MHDTIADLNRRGVIVSMAQSWYHTWTVELSFPLPLADSRRDDLYGSWLVRASHADLDTALRLAQDALCHDPAYPALYPERAGVEQMRQVAPVGP